MPTITPEESELKEGGMFEEARRELMRSEESQLESQIGIYVQSLKAELEPHGYTVVLMSVMFSKHEF